MSGLGPVVALLWKELGMAPPPGRIGSDFDFELGDLPVTLAVQDDGETVLVRGRIGYLEGNVHEAGDQLGRVLRLGLAMTGMNPAALDAGEAEDVLERDHEGLVPVFAVATASLRAPASILPAVRALLDWQTATETILTRTDEAGEPSGGPRRTASPGDRDGDMIIFQP